MKVWFNKAQILWALESIRRVAEDPEVQAAWRELTLALKPKPTCDRCKKPIEHNEARRSTHQGRHVTTAHVLNCMLPKTDP